MYCKNYILIVCITIGYTFMETQCQMTCDDGHFYKYKEKAEGYNIEEGYNDCYVIAQGNASDPYMCKEEATANGTVDAIHFVQDEQCKFFKCELFDINDPQQIVVDRASIDVYIRCDHIKELQLKYYAAADSRGVYYADGQLLGSTANKRDLLISSLLVTTQVLAVEITKAGGNGGFLYMETSDFRLHTHNERIKCSSGPVHNTDWTFPNYDDATWVTPNEVYSGRNPNNYFRQSLPPGAKLASESRFSWVDLNTDTLYCRMELWIHDEPSCGDPPEVYDARPLYPFSIQERILYQCFKGYFSDGKIENEITCTDRKWLKDNGKEIDAMCTYNLGQWELNRVNPGANAFFSNTNWSTIFNGYIDGATQLDTSMNSYIQIQNDGAYNPVDTFTIFMYIQPNTTDIENEMGLFTWLDADTNIATHVNIKSNQVIVRLHGLDGSDLEYIMDIDVISGEWKKLAVSLKTYELYYTADCVGEVHIQYDETVSTYHLTESECRMTRQLDTSDEIYIGTYGSSLYQGNISCVELWYGFFDLNEFSSWSGLLGHCFIHCAPHHDVWLAEVTPDRYTQDHSPHGTQLTYKCKYIYRFPNGDKSMTTTCSNNNWDTSIPHQCVGLAGFWPLDYAYPTRDISLQHNPDSVQIDVTLTEGPWSIPQRAMQLSNSLSSNIELLPNNGTLDINGSLTFTSYIYLKSGSAGPIFTYPSNYPTTFVYNPTNNGKVFQLIVTNMENASENCELLENFNNINPNAWHRVAFSFDMVNGELQVLVGDTDGSGDVVYSQSCNMGGHWTHNTTQNPILGARELISGNKYFDGKIACVQIYAGAHNLNTFDWEDARHPCFATCPAFVHVYGSTDDVIGYMENAWFEINVDGREIFREQYDTANPTKMQGYFFVKVNEACENTSAAHFDPLQVASEGYNIDSLMESYQYGDVVIMAFNNDVYPSEAVGSIYMNRFTDIQFETSTIHRRSKHALVTRYGSIFITHKDSSKNVDPMALNIGLYAECGNPLDFPFSSHYDIHRQQFYHEDMDINNRYGIGSTVKYVCDNGFTFPDDTTEKIATCLGTDIVTEWDYPDLCQAMCAAELLSWSIDDPELPYIYDKHVGFINVGNENVIGINGYDDTQRGLHLVTLDSNCTVKDSQSFVAQSSSSSASARQSLATFLSNQDDGTIIMGVVAFSQLWNIHEDSVGELLHELQIPYWELEDELGYSMSFVTRVNADDVSYEYDVSPDGPSHLQKAIERGCGNPLNHLHPYATMTITDYDDTYNFPIKAKYYCISNAEFHSGANFLEANCIIQDLFGYWEYPDILDQCEAYCVFGVCGFGLNDPHNVREVYFEINGVKEYTSDQSGFHLAEITNFCELGDVDVFNTNLESEQTQLNNALNQYTAGKILISGTANSVVSDSESYLTVTTQLQNLGFTNVISLGFQDSAAFIGNKSHSSEFVSADAKQYQGPACVAASIVWYCPVPSINNGYVESYTGINPESTAIYICDESYHFTLYDTNRTSNCLFSGTWSDVGSCEGIRCPSLSAVDNGDYNSSTCTSGVHLYPNTCEMTCEGGFYMEGDAINVCQVDETWSTSNTPTCHIHICVAIPELENGYYSHADCTGSGTTGREYSKTCMATCNTGYYGEGGMSVTCNSDGTWSSDDFAVCIIHTCDMLVPVTTNVKCPECPIMPTVLNSDWNNPLCSQVDTEYNSICAASCDVGYNLIGDATLWCDETGNWNSTSYPHCEIKNCDALPAVANGTYFPSTCQIARQDYPQSCTLLCDVMHSAQGNIIQSCTAEEIWSDEFQGHSFPNCTRNRVCQTPSNGRNSTLILPQIELVIGLYVNYHCITGYEEVFGENRRYCLLSEEWSGDPLGCDPVNCTIPHVPLNAVFNNASVNSSQVKYMEMISYECEIGYEWINGDPLRYCQADKSFSGVELLCRKKLCYDLPVIPNAYMMTGNGSYLDKVTYECMEGYNHTSGNLTRTCLLSKVWDGISPTCTEITCSTPPLVNNTVIDAIELSISGVAHYRCLNGYLKTGGNDSMHCNIFGQWEGYFLQCEELDCGEPEVDYLHSVDIYGNTLYDKTLHICVDGYEHSEGLSTTMCTDESQWEVVHPICLEIDCGLPIEFMYSLYQVGSTVHNSIAEYQCTDGTIVNSNETTSVCTDDDWSVTSFHCEVKECIVPHNRADSVISLFANQSIPIYAVVETCLDNYTMVSGDTAKLCFGGEWNGEILICQETVCEELQVGVTDNLVSLSGNMVGDVAFYECPQNSQLLRGDTQRTCLYTGLWSGTAPACQEILCEDIEDFVHASELVFGYYNKSVGSLAFYSCIKGYSLIDNATGYIECSTNGSWMGIQPDCEEIRCLDDVAILNGTFNSSEESYLSKGYFTCDEGFSMQDGHEELVCGEDGNWLGDIPFCLLNECEMPAYLPAHGYMNITSLTVGSIITYSCDHMYHIDGVYNQICLANGSWSDKIPQCKRMNCSSPPNFENTTWLYDKEFYPMNEKVVYVCEPGHMRVHNNISVEKYCLTSGNWTEGEIVCEEDEVYGEIRMDGVLLFSPYKLVSEEIGAFTESDRQLMQTCIGISVTTIMIILMSIIVFLDLITILYRATRKKRFLRNKIMPK